MTERPSVAEAMARELIIAAIQNAPSRRRDPAALLSAARSMNGAGVT